MSSSVALRDQKAPSGLSIPQQRAPATKSRNLEASLGVRELEALRKADFVAPPEAAEAAEPLVLLYQGRAQTGDRLRLPQLTSLDNTAMRAAMSRVLSVDTTNASPAVAKMHRMLEALEAVVGQIAVQSSPTNNRE